MHFTYTHTLTFIHIYNGVLFSQKKEILLLVTTRMEFEGIPLNEISQTEKDKNWMISLICGILKKRNLINTEIRLMVVTSGKGYGMAEMQERGQNVQKLVW